MARPLLAKAQVEHARRIGATHVAHGCTGKGNDQVRFELAYMALAPELQLIAPWREWDIRSREDALAYAERRGIPVAARRRLPIGRRWWRSSTKRACPWRWRAGGWRPRPCSASSTLSAAVTAWGAWTSPRTAWWA
jgi:hypothetical protein